MRLASSGIDGVTITGHSSMSTAANFLVLRAFDEAGATRADMERFVVGSSGEIRTHQKSVVNVSTASTAPTLGASQSGGVFVLGNWTSGPRVLLPAPERGLVYTIIQASGGTSHALHVSATRGTNAKIRAPFRGSGVSTALVVGAPTTVAGMGAVFLAISTLTWQMFPALNGIQGGSAGFELSGCWTTVAA
jgi:hypothetical protein